MSNQPPFQQELPLFESEPSRELLLTEASQPPSGRFSRYVVYVDESGDHGMQTVDPNYPVFVLAFCVFHKRHYAESVVPALHKFKFNNFGHDLVVLHETDIRKEKGEFRFQSRKHLNAFMDELTSVIERSNFVLISCVIDKAQLGNKHTVPPNPYHVALEFCLEAVSN